MSADEGCPCEDCIDPLCRRVYDPGPDAACLPHPERDYEGTGIGALFGLTPMTPALALHLAGWSLPRPTDRRHQLEGWDYPPRGRPG